LHSFRVLSSIFSEMKSTNSSVYFNFLKSILIIEFSVVNFVQNCEETDEDTEPRIGATNLPCAEEARKDTVV
jgi:hypothetical protein